MAKRNGNTYANYQCFITEVYRLIINSKPIKGNSTTRKYEVNANALNLLENEGVIEIDKYSKATHAGVRYNWTGGDIGAIDFKSLTDTLLDAGSAACKAGTEAKEPEQIHEPVVIELFVDMNARLMAIESAVNGIHDMMADLHNQLS